MNESISWCKSIGISKKELFQQIDPGYIPKNPEDLYRDIFAWAKDEESKLPVEMGYGGDIELIFNLCRIVQARKVIETGVARGWSSLSILLSFEDKKGKLVSTDMPYPKMNNESHVGCVIRHDLRDSWELLRLPDRKGLPIALDKTKEIDLCHYDSDKSYVGRKWAYPLLWKHIRKGGVFISDDINDNIAFKEFAEEVQVKPLVVEFESKFIGILQKP